MAFPWAAVIPAAAEFLGGLFGGGEEQVSGFQPFDMFQRQTQTIGPQTQEEQEIAMLQRQLLDQLFGEAGQGLPGSLSLARLAAGEIPQARQERITEQAYGGLEEAGRRVSSQARERALAAGVPLSSQQFIEESEMNTRLATEAARQRASLEQQSLTDLMGLRQRAIANMIALRQSPELERLLRMRLAQGTTENLQMGRFPGGLPRSAYGPGDMEYSPQQTRINELVNQGKLIPKPGGGYKVKSPFD